VRGLTPLFIQSGYTEKPLMLKSTKHIMVIVGILIFAGGGVFMFWKYWLPVSIRQPTMQEGSTTAPIEWLTYRDEAHGFLIDYPSDLVVHLEKDGVAFTEGEGGIGISSVTKALTGFITPNEWFAALEPDTKQVTAIDRPITIAGYPGLVIRHFIEEGSPNFSLSVVFIRDGYLFRISDRSSDYERTWNSFRFEE